jgi:hypothetical protein
MVAGLTSSSRLTAKTYVPSERRSVEAGQESCETRSKEPKDASIRRAISTAYYALFHFLLDEATGILVGEGPNDEAMRHILSRCFVHGRMWAACENFQGSPRTSPPSGL